MEFCSYENHGFKEPVFLLIQTNMAKEEIETFESDCEKINAKILSHQSELPYTPGDAKMCLWVVVDASSAPMFIIKYGSIIETKILEEQMLTLLNKVRDAREDEQLSLIAAMAKYEGDPAMDVIIDDIVTISSIPTIFNKAISAMTKCLDANPRSTRE